MPLLTPLTKALHCSQSRHLHLFSTDLTLQAFLNSTEPSEQILPLTPSNLHIISSNSPSMKLFFPSLQIFGHFQILRTFQSLFFPHTHFVLNLLIIRFFLVPLYQNLIATLRLQHQKFFVLLLSYFNFMCKHHKGRYTSFK